MKIDYDSDKTVSYAYIILGILYLILPFGWIWALNTLFSTAIEYSFINYIAAILLNTFFSNGIKVKVK